MRVDRSRILPVVVSVLAPDWVVIMPDVGAANTEDGGTEVTEAAEDTDAGGSTTGGGTKMPSCPRNQPVGGC